MEPKNKESLLSAVNQLKLISNPKRLEVLCNLEQEDLTVNELAERVGLSQSALSQHLKLLKDEEIVTFQRDHNKLYYSLCCEKIKKLIMTLRKLYCDNE